MLSLYEELKEAIGAKNALVALSFAGGVGLSILGIAILLSQQPQQPPIIILNSNKEGVR